MRARTSPPIAPSTSTPIMSFKFGLSVKKKTGAGFAKPGKPAQGKKKPLLDDEEETPSMAPETANRAQEIDEFNLEDALATAPKPEQPAPKARGRPSGPPSRKPLAKPDDPTTLENAASMYDAEQRAKEAMEIDPSIYDYDSAYDALHAKTAAKKAAEREDALQRRPKYMENLFESAEQRKKDQLRARDKLLKREREAEGDEFADKEKFVTEAYKTQQEEARKAEEEEKRRQALEDENRRKFGMQGFHKQMLMEEEKRHQEAMEAAAQAAKGGLNVNTDEPKEKTEADIARELQAQGKNIVLTEEGQVADKRQLLSAGLNIIAKPKKATPAPAASSRPSGPPAGLQGRNATQRDVRARHTQMVLEQIEHAAKRKADEEAEERAKLQHASKSQKTASDISSAKERYLQRKREAAATKDADR